MAFMITLDFPVPHDVIEDVSRELGAVEDPPDGLIAHVVVDTDTGCRVIDLWESQAQMDAFREARLDPAMGKVFAGRGVDPAAHRPEVAVTPVYDVVRGR